MDLNSVPPNEKPAAEEVIFEIRGGRDWTPPPLRALPPLLYSAALLWFTLKLCLLTSFHLRRGELPEAGFELVLILAVLYLVHLVWWSYWAAARLVTSVRARGGEVTVERRRGRWVGLSAELRMYRVRWPIGYSSLHYRLEAKEGVYVGEIVALWPELMEADIRDDVERLKAWMIANGAGYYDKPSGFLFEQEVWRRRVGRALEKWPLRGQTLFFFWLAGAYGGLIAAAASWQRLGSWALLAVAGLLVEVPVVVSALGGYRGGRERKKTMESVFWFSQVALAVVSLSGLWALGEASYWARYLTPLVGVVSALVFLNEWAIPGSIFGARGAGSGGAKD